MLCQCSKIQRTHQSIQPHTQTRSSNALSLECLLKRTYKKSICLIRPSPVYEVGVQTLIGLKFLSKPNPPGFAMKDVERIFVAAMANQ